MTKATHTPGPWSIYEGLSNGPRKYIGYANTHDASGAPNAIAWMDVHSHTGSEANARLIAAAPELLEALEHAVGKHKHSQYWVEQARAAIAKAKGE